MFLFRLLRILSVLRVVCVQFEAWTISYGLFLSRLGNNTLNGTSEVFSYNFLKERELGLPCPWPSALPTVPASCCPLQHLLSVKMPVATGTCFLKSPSSEEGLAGDLSFLILPRKSSSFLSCLDYLHITSQRKDNQSGWLFSFAPNLFI